jgi:hypothetical protein|tara:strand:- start:6911 stop:7618 length:708 start_codon:yes stop_codon:yes gene_type:complete
VKKSIAIMQPYFLPYIGYFHLINSVDEFVIYDNIQYTKKGWINRNRILVNSNDKIITLPIKKDSDYLDVKDRVLADSWGKEKIKILNLIKSSYKKAPYYNKILPVISSIFALPNNNLFDFILGSLHLLNSYLRIDTKITISSNVNIDHTLKGRDKVVAICKKLNANTYINAIGGQELYNIQDFKNEDLNLKFIKSSPLNYKQYNNEFIPWLSVLDVLMFNKRQDITNYLNKYTLI